jgi:hypothetical protein
MGSSEVSLYFAPYTCIHVKFAIITREQWSGRNFREAFRQVWDLHLACLRLMGLDWYRVRLAMRWIGLDWHGWIG